MPMPIRFGGVPTGVPMPPMEAPNDVISMIDERELAGARSGCRHAPGARTIDSPIGYIIAVVAVLLIHIERQHGDPAEHEQDARGAAADEALRTAR